MEQIFSGAVMFLCGVGASWLIFIRTNKSDKANRDPLAEQVKSLTGQFAMLAKDVQSLKREKLSRTDSIEVLDHLKLVRQEQILIREMFVEDQLAAKKFEIEMQGKFNDFTNEIRRDYIDVIRDKSSEMEAT